MLKIRLRTSLTENNLVSLILIAIEKDNANQIKSNNAKSLIKLQILPLK